MPFTAFLGLGSNLGHRAHNLRLALNALAAHPDITITSTADFIETDPIGPADQPKYINTACAITTSLLPRRLLEACRAIEEQLGRNRQKETIRWGPRLIDIDILLYDDIVMNEPELVIPHPRMHEREFVLKPLREIAPDTIDPASGRSIRQLAAILNAGQ